jgi:mono/diheme cytochrome c family protein
VGSSQREATIVAIGLVIVATLVVVYMFNEPNRRDTAAADKRDEKVERGVETFVQYCVACHGPEGKGGEGRLGVPLNTEQNQSDDPAIGPAREKVIRDTITRGRGEIMPAWGQSEGGPLNDEHIDDLVVMIREGAWEQVHEAAREASGGADPTPPPQPTTDPNLGGAELGRQLFDQVCDTCHIANDFPNGGQVGPDLTGLGALDQTPVVGIDVNAEALTAWINDPQSTQRWRDRLGRRGR